MSESTNEKKWEIGKADGYIGEIFWWTGTDYTEIEALRDVNRRNLHEANHRGLREPNTWYVREKPQSKEG